MPFFDDPAATFLDEVFQRADAFLFGRWTYEVFAGYWGSPRRQQLHRSGVERAPEVLADPQ